MTNPWQRIEGEGTQAFDAFLCYLYLEPRERSIDKAYSDAQPPQKPRKSTAKNPRASKHWNDWAVQFKWVERANAYDDYLAALQFVTRQELEMAKAREAVLRRENIQNLERGLAEELIERAREMLRLPITRKVANKDGEGFTIEPVRFTARDIVAYIEAADKLYRLSAGMHTDHSRLDVMQVQNDAANYCLDVASKTLPQEWYDSLELALTK
jgi:hypothetical protein